MKIICTRNCNSCRMINSTNTDISSATPPICIGGTNLLNALTGGSVITNSGSAITMNQRGGLNWREKDWIISIMMRIISTKVYSLSNASRMIPNAVTLQPYQQ